MFALPNFERKFLWGFKDEYETTLAVNDSDTRVCTRFDLKLWNTQRWIQAVSSNTNTDRQEGIWPKPSGPSAFSSRLQKNKKLKWYYDDGGCETTENKRVGPHGVQFTLRVVRQDQEVDAGSAGSGAKDGDPLRVSSEVADVLVEPAKGLDLVQQAVVPLSGLIPRTEEACSGNTENRKKEKWAWMWMDSSKIRGSNSIKGNKISIQFLNDGK